MGIQRKIAIWTAAAGIASLGLAASASASSEVVDTNADTTDNTCTAAPGDCSLRDAVFLAGNGDTVTFLNASIDPVLNPVNGQINIGADVTIQGLGQGATTISGNDGTSIFFVVGGTAPDINDLTLTDGHALNGMNGVLATDGASGGAIYNNGGTLTLSRVALTSNEAGKGGNGAPGIMNVAGTIGKAGGEGGAVYSLGSLTLVNSTLSANRAGAGGTGGDGGMGGVGMNGASGGMGGRGGEGGAIFALGPLTVIASTIGPNNASGAGGTGGTGGSPGAGGMMSGAGGAGNRAGNGGGIYANAALTITNSTVAQNSAGIGGGGVNPAVPPTGLPGDGGSGGGIYGSGAITGKQVTIAVNSTPGPSGPGGTVGQGGGIFSNGTAQLDGSLLAGNSAVNVAAGLNCFGTVSGSQSISFAGAFASGCPFGGGNPLLSGLAANGGPTLTMAIGPGAAVDVVSGANCEATDQRGVGRPIGAACDAGAYERPLDPPPASTPTTTPPATTTPAKKKCKKGKKRNKKGKCVKKKKKKKKGQ